MAKRIFKRDIDLYDERNDESNVRELEMLVDACVNDQGHVIQFWRDMSTYGLHEAILYLAQVVTKDDADFQRVLDFERVFTQKHNSLREHTAACIRGTFANMEEVE